MTGATIANYCEIKNLTKSEDGKVNGAIVVDRQSKKEFQVKAKVVINCAGASADVIRQMDNAEAEKRII